VESSTGIENQSGTCAINSAVLANLSIYTLDIRGLQALLLAARRRMPACGNVTYSGQAQLNALNSNFQTQETLVTGGGHRRQGVSRFQRFRARLQGVQEDTSITVNRLSARTQQRRQIPRITVKVNRPGLKIDFRR
jgi:hypothetical protein